MFYHVIWWELSSAAARSERVFPLFAATPFNASLLAIKNTTLDHKLIVKVAGTFLRGRAALQAEITPLVGVNLRWAGTETWDGETGSCYF